MLQQIALGGTMIALPIYLQMVLEYNAMQAGLSLAPLSLTMFAVALLAGSKAGKRRPASIIRLGLPAADRRAGGADPGRAAGRFRLVPAGPAGRSPAPGLGLLVSQLNNYTLAPISEEQVSEAAGVNSAAGSFGLSFGLAFAGAIMLATLSITFTSMADVQHRAHPGRATAGRGRAGERRGGDEQHRSWRSSSPVNPQQIQDEIIRINTDARPFALQVALLIPILAGADRVVQLVPDDAPAGPQIIGLRGGHGLGLTVPSPTTKQPRRPPAPPNPTTNTRQAAAARSVDQ